jgi:hypothetical protein
MIERVILVVVFRAVETFQRCHLGYHRRRKNLLPVELLDVRRRNALLLVIRVEERRAIRRSDIRPLTVELRRVVRY